MNNKTFANRREKLLARQMGGALHRQSGAGRVKGDFTVGQFKCDLKSTKGKSITVTSAMLDKITNEAWDVGKDPAIVLDFGDKVWYVIPERLVEKDA